MVAPSNAPYGRKPRQAPTTAAGRPCAGRGGCVERVVDPDDAILLIRESLRQLAQADCAIENAGTGRETAHLAYDHRQPVLMPRAEHLGLRAPGMRSRFVISP